MLKKGIFCLIVVITALSLSGIGTAMAANDPCVTGQGYYSAPENPSAQNPIIQPAGIKTDPGNGVALPQPTEKGEDQRALCQRWTKFIKYLNPILGFVTIHGAL